MEEYGSRKKALPAPQQVVWDSLVDPRMLGARPWLDLLDEEIEPAILECRRPTHVVWSSMWPSRPDDQIIFSLDSRVVAGVGEPPSVGGTSLRFALMAVGSPPDRDTAERLAKRMSYMLFGELRRSYGQ